MRRVLLAGSFLIALVVAATGGVGCGDNSPGSAGSGGRGGSAGSVGTAGVGGGTAGGGSAATGGGGNATGAGGASAPSPEEIHDSLINAQTTGGIAVTRPQPAFSPPTCQ